MKVMLSLITLGALAFASQTLLGAESGAMADRLARELDRAEVISIFIFTSTGRGPRDATRLKNEASIKIERGCGGNCTNQMSAILDHLRDAQPFRCEPGFENILIEFARTAVVYRHSGQVIEVHGECFRNDDSVRHLIESVDFIFR